MPLLFRSKDKSDSATKKVNWMTHHRAADAAARLGIACGRGIAASSWFAPREGALGADGKLHPFPLAVRPDHAANVDALLALHGQWPHAMGAFLAVGDFGDDGVPLGAMSRAHILACGSELVGHGARLQHGSA